MGKSKEPGTSLRGTKWKLNRDTLINHNYTKTMKTTNPKMGILITGTRGEMTRTLGSGMGIGGRGLG